MALDGMYTRHTSPLDATCHTTRCPHKYLKGLRPSHACSRILPAEQSSSGSVWKVLWNRTTRSGAPAQTKLFFLAAQRGVSCFLF